jgi:hypothetical protein
MSVATMRALAIWGLFQIVGLAFVAAQVSLFRRKQTIAAWTLCVVVAASLIALRLSWLARPESFLAGAWEEGAYVAVTLIGVPLAGATWTARWAMARSPVYRNGVLTLGTWVVFLFLSLLGLVVSAFPELWRMKWGNY